MSDRELFALKNKIRLFRWAAIAFAVALAVHGADHVRRGLDAVPPAVMVAGTIQLVLAAVTVALVFTRSRWAPHAAIAIGFASAVGFTAAHLLPRWGFFSDSFIAAPPSARITTFSWVSAVLEVIVDLAFAIAGIALLRAGMQTSHRPSGRLTRQSTQCRAPVTAGLESPGRAPIGSASSRKIKAHN